MSRTSRLTLTLFFGMMIVALCATFFFWKWLNEDVVVTPENLALVVERGDTLNTVSRSLHERNLMRWPKVWIFYAKVKGLTHIRAGEYLLDSSESPLTILTKLHSNDVVQYQVTIVEGLRTKDAFDVIQKHPKIQKKMASIDDLMLRSEQGGAVEHVEGWLYPDTYNFISGDTDAQIVQRAYQKMQRVLNEEWLNREDNLPYKTAYEALIMASIIEKETGAAHERAEIAGVFVRRLQKGMRLQTDPTVIYGLGARYDGNITRRDLKQPTPYNTYLIKGLPPTPIALPGRDAIHAALHPKQGKTLYFVARGDGTHVFSETLKQHLEAVRVFQLNRKKNYRSKYQPDKQINENNK